MMGPFSIVFGIYGVGFHTSAYNNREDACKAYIAMKQEYQCFIEGLEAKCNDDVHAEEDSICEWFTDFADRYPFWGSGPATAENSYETETEWEFITTEVDGNTKTGYFRRKDNQ